MQEVSFDEAVELIRAKDQRYDREAYLFIREALDYTQKQVTGGKRERVRHVTGQELLGGVRDYAISQYGPMTMMMLGEWGIHSCRDFGEIVFNMVEIGLLAKTEKDSREDFADGYDFFEAFRRPFMPTASQRQNSVTPQRPATSV